MLDTVANRPAAQDRAALGLGGSGQFGRVASGPLSQPVPKATRQHPRAADAGPRHFGNDPVGSVVFSVFRIVVKGLSSGIVDEGLGRRPIGEDHVMGLRLNMVDGEARGQVCQRQPVDGTMVDQGRRIDHQTVLDHPVITGHRQVRMRHARPKGAGPDADQRPVLTRESLVNRLTPDPFDRHCGAILGDHLIADPQVFDGAFTIGGCNRTSGGEAELENRTNRPALPPEIARRRTFAIISHPDAGKTTLTEKFLLYGGAIQMAGQVRAKGEARRTRSDFMQMEKDRGISVSASAMSFDYQRPEVNYRFNLVDTPGHSDFSEDTYRTLTAVDAAIMVIDGAKGVESQTQKLFEVCRLRDLPILTFCNKMDRESRDTFEIIDEIQENLAIDVTPPVWPIGVGRDFLGCYDLIHDRLGTDGPRRPQQGGRDQCKIDGLDDPKLAEHIPADLLEQLKRRGGDGARIAAALDQQAFLEGT
jgi:small GTP-binding protein